MFEFIDWQVIRDSLIRITKNKKLYFTNNCFHFICKVHGYIQQLSDQIMELF
jgi:hypothetical protein